MPPRGPGPVSADHLGDERSARLAQTDLRVSGILPSFDESGQPQRADVYLANRGPEAVTVTAANLGSQDAVLVPLTVPAGESVTLTIPLARACGHPLASGDLSLRVRTADGAERRVLLRDGLDFLLNGLTDVWSADCGVQSLSQLSISTQVVVDRAVLREELLPAVGQLRTHLAAGRRTRARAHRAALGRGGAAGEARTGLAGADVDRRVEHRGGGPPRDVLPGSAPADPDNDALLQVEGQVTPGAATESANLFGASVSLALVRAIESGRARSS